MSGTVLPSHCLDGNLFMMVDLGIVLEGNLHVPHF